MSLKAIEMQVALPRTHDAGKIQEQFQQRSQISHDLASREMQKEVEKHEKSVLKNSQKDKLSLKKDDSSDFDEQNHAREEKKKNKKDPEIKHVHPYKGNAIDFSG